MEGRYPSHFLPALTQLPSAALAYWLQRILAADYTMPPGATPPCQDLIRSLLHPGALLCGMQPAGAKGTAMFTTAVRDGFKN